VDARCFRALQSGPLLRFDDAAIRLRWLHEMGADLLADLACDWAPQLLSCYECDLGCASPAAQLCRSSWLNVFAPRRAPSAVSATRCSENRDRWLDVGMGLLRAVDRRRDGRAPFIPSWSPAIC
jgi:hypothetical protein